MLNGILPIFFLPPRHTRRGQQRIIDSIMAWRFAGYLSLICIPLLKQKHTAETKDQNHDRLCLSCFLGDCRNCTQWCTLPSSSNTTFTHRHAWIPPVWSSSSTLTTSCHSWKHHIWHILHILWSQGLCHSRKGGGGENLGSYPFWQYTKQTRLDTHHDMSCMGAWNYPTSSCEDLLWTLDK